MLPHASTLPTFTLFFREEREEEEREEEETHAKGLGGREDDRLVPHVQEKEEATSGNHTSVLQRTRACKNTQKGVANGSVNGIGVHSLTISDPVASRLEAGTWDQNYTHGGNHNGSNAPRQRTPAVQHTNEQLYKCRICDRMQPMESLRTDAKENLHCTGVASTGCATGRRRCNRGADATMINQPV